MQEQGEKFREPNPDEVKRQHLQEMQEAAQAVSEFHLDQAGQRGKPGNTERAPEFRADIPGITRPEVHKEEGSEAPIKSVKDLNASLERGLENILSGKQGGDPTDWVSSIEKLQSSSEE